MLNSTHTRNASKIARVLDGGVDFYQQGIDNISGDNVRAMFRRMVDEKQKAIAMMKPFIVSDNDDDDDWYAEFEKLYSSVAKKAAEMSDKDFISGLEEAETKVMALIESILNDIEHSSFASELRRMRTRMQQCKDEMASLKNAVT
ncbi:DUF2383 domain-containing protein [Alteromonas halophila]|uniref:DUF2383 domain-containing protein n=1 Tax=Alteromonas halophila TaxID=516698 RepID=A0A918MYY0_9ALTE|nr:DUF2383 domain-containing protein [Alteromonas halophila]GGW89943.1 hypothetical protein GCM10007391_25350 [Alteromonas halophila]